MLQNNFNRPPSRSQVYPEQHFYANQNPYPPPPPHRGPTPSRDLQIQSGPPRGQTPSFEGGGSVPLSYGNNTNYANYHTTHQGPTPSREMNQPGPTPRDLYIADKRHYSEDSAFRATDLNNGNAFSNYSHNRDHVTHQDNRTAGGGSYGNSMQAYREPVYTSMAGTRPVKPLSTQPNSAKV